MRLVTAVLARNEADRYLARVLEHCRQWSDAVLLLDDRSTDATARVAADLGCEVRGRSILKDPAWGAEAPARAELWDWAAKEAGSGWVLVCDADMILHGDPRPLTASWSVNTWCWPLYDLWDDEQHARIDGPWAAGPALARPWMFRPSVVPEGWTPDWRSARGIHSGHAPPNFPVLAAVAPGEYYWLHLGWVNPSDREEKHRRYMSVREQLTPFELNHANSILV